MANLVTNVCVDGLLCEEIFRFEVTTCGMRSHLRSALRHPLSCAVLAVCLAVTFEDVFSIALWFFYSANVLRSYGFRATSADLNEKSPPPIRPGYGLGAT